MDDRPTMRRPLSNEPVAYQDSSTYRRATARETRRALASAAVLVFLAAAALVMLVGIAAPLPA